MLLIRNILFGSLSLLRPIVFQSHKPANILVLLNVKFGVNTIGYVWYALPTRIFTVSRALGNVTPSLENMPKGLCLNSDYTYCLEFRFIV